VCLCVSSLVIMPEPRFDYEHPQAGKAKAATRKRPAARSTVKNGSRTTLIARKLAATTSLVRKSLGNATNTVNSGRSRAGANVGCRTTFPETEHFRPRAALSSCVLRMMARVSGSRVRWPPRGRRTRGQREVRHRGCPARTAAYPAFGWVRQPPRWGERG